jgi:bile acid:Na+ symporter, BASS family
MQQIVDIAIPVITFILLVAVGLDLTLSDFRRVRERPALVAAGVFLPPLLLPPLALLLIRLLGPPRPMGEALVLLVVCPIGGLSNVYSLLARASTALSVTMTAVSCAAALATIPLAVVLLNVVWQHPLGQSVPVMVLVQQLLAGLTPPVLLGMAIRWHWPDVARRHRVFIQGGGFTLLLALLALIISTGGGGSDLRLGKAAQLVVAFVGSAFLTGWVSAWLLRGSRADQFTFGAEYATRNVPVALAIALSLTDPRTFLWFGAIYLAIEIPLLSLAAAARRRFTASGDELLEGAPGPAEL